MKAKVNAPTREQAEALASRARALFAKASREEFIAAMTAMGSTLAEESGEFPDDETRLLAGLAVASEFLANMRR